MLMGGMYQVVVDTNVVVSAVLSNRGASHEILRMLGRGDPRWTMNLSVPLVLEYEQVLKRMCVAGPIDTNTVDDILSYVCAAGQLRPVFFLWRPVLPDPKDHMVLELAVECRAHFIVTFNRKDFVPVKQFGIEVVTPSSFLAILGQKP